MFKLIRIRRLLTNTADLLVLDGTLPGISGIDLAQILRFKIHSESLPIILLTAYNPEADKPSALEIGIDDYMIKPFSPNEFMTRIQKVLGRRLSNGHTEHLKIGDLILDLEERQLLIGDRRLDLTPIEFKLLEFLMRYPDKVHTRNELLEEVWGRSIYIEVRTVDQQIRRLRARLSEYGREELIQTVRGLGYRFSVIRTLN
ncbi:winged helix-turn-helix domain-containing protein [Methylomicrobium sp. Wu6]|uniref:winged helix-turn-helix domain-containing protein n=1 Tax=Methylomicrobium sp. Wu6 TaxID=3107928 RepID=UPI002DD63B35|nr:winged helix-turn-helix domain-containing protein [Methylomicrobium sp. Wu6]MEC4748626.1 winged helix-turn-helix domain-containing protein [Methylomicrobium sp. Wu6]